MCIGLPTSSPKLQCTLFFFCRAANGIATQTKSHTYAPWWAITFETALRFRDDCLLGGLPASVFYPLDTPCCTPLVVGDEGRFPSPTSHHSQSRTVTHVATHSHVTCHVSGTVVSNTFCLGQNIIKKMQIQILYCNQHTFCNKPGRGWPPLEFRVKSFEGLGQCPG
jgi:hypothetical protein